MKRLPFICRALSLVLFATFLLAPCASAGLTEAIQAFDEGNRHYAVGNYAGAVDSYRQAIAEGHVSAALLYNLGNAYYRQDELGEAVRAYERARRIAPRDAEVLHNISLTRERTADRFTPLPVPYWQQAWRSVVRFAGAWGLFFVGILCWFTAAAAIIRRTLTGSNAPWLRRTMAASLVAGCLFLIAAYGASVDDGLHRQGVILTEEVALRAEPTDAANVELDVHEGLIVDVLRQEESWVLVRLPNGVRGWTPVEAVGEIDL